MLESEIENGKTSLYQKLKDRLTNSEYFKKLVKSKNYNKLLPGEEYSMRMKENVKELYLTYSVLFALGFILLCIRDLSCFVILASWIAYIVFCESGHETMDLGHFSLNSTHVLIAVVGFDLAYLFLFRKVFMTVLLYSIGFTGLALAHTIIFKENTEEEIPVL